MKKVIFIPGFTGNSKDIQIIKSTLKNFKIIYFDYNTRLKSPLDETAKKLKKFIDNLKLNKGIQNILIFSCMELFSFGHQ